ncbi:MAG: glucuronate isomerase [Planctomycetota bacterium]
MTRIADLDVLDAAVRHAVDQATITDIHTHLFPPGHGDLLLWGIDELLTYHYLVAELFTVAPAELTYEAFWAMDKAAQADQVWKHLFLEASPLSEARRGVLTVLERLGLDPGDRDLGRIRRWFAEQDEEAYLQRVVELAGLDYAVMTNNPVKPNEVKHFDAGAPVPAPLRTALRIDDVILDFAGCRPIIAAQGCAPGDGTVEGAAGALQGWLGGWIDRIDPVYMAASLDCAWAYPLDDAATRMIDHVVCPLAAERGLPVALMIGVHRQVNPGLGDAGDAVAPCDVNSIIRLVAAHPDVKFLVTTLSRVDQHALAVAGRKFRNLHLFGCWWFCNNPSIINEMTRQRLELLGTNVTVQHSDARVLDQLIYKWHHTRRIVADVLVDKYADAHRAGWRFTADEIARDVRQIFGGAFEDFRAR